MIEKINKSNFTGNDLIDKLNEIIDFLNDTYLMKVKDGQFGTLNNNCSLATTQLNDIYDSVRDYVSINRSIKCPHCGESYYTEMNSMSTCVYYPPIWKDGVNINPDQNKTTTHCKCLSCGEEFDI